MDALIQCIGFGLCALIVTIACVPLAKRIAKATNAIDYPSGRRVNKQPTPRLGGVAVAIGMAVPMILLYVLVNTGAMDTPFGGHPVLTVDWTITGIGILIMLGVGVADDIYNLSPTAKLIGQIIAACVIAGSGVLLESIGNPFTSTTMPLGIWAYPASVAYIVIFANIINLIDGLDGLASSITIVAAASMMVFAFMAMRLDSLLIGSVIIGACLGFLRYNHHPASIFLGDSGSLLLGTMLGILSLVSIARSSLFMSLLLPFIAAGVPLIDTVSAIIRRGRGHQPIGKADRGHIHHKLLEAGFSQTKAVAIMVGWTALLSACGIAVTFLHTWLRYVIFAVMIVVSIVMVVRLGILRPVIAHAGSPRISPRHVADGTFTEDEYHSARKSMMGGGASEDDEGKDENTES